MYQLPLTLETPAENLALDEALLEAAAAGELAGDVLRIWESLDYFVVLGRSSAVAEVRPDACAADGVRMLRRPSGGATVVAGPGCLMYAVVLDLEPRPELRNVDLAHRVVLERIAEALAPLAPGIALQGTSDLTLAAASPGEPSRKFSGNSLRVKRNALLYHGTILYNFPLQRLGRWLDRPARRPEYRGERDHETFVTNFPADRHALTESLLAAWNAREPLVEWPRQRTQELAVGRYASLDW
jgi:lipoate-protein ligase A